MVNTCRKHVKCFICKRKLFHQNWLEAYNQQCHPISMNEGILPDGILPPAGWDRPEPSWFNFSRYTWIVIDELSQWIHLPIKNVPGAPQPEDTPDKEIIDPLKPDLTCTPDPTMTRAQRQVVGVKNMGRESIWQSNWIVQQASQVLTTMESMTSISVSTRQSTGSII